MHLAAVLVWFGGLLLTAVVVCKGAFGETPEPSERKLLMTIQRWDRIVTSPAMFLVWALGITLAVKGGWFGQGWLWLKILFVVALSAIHGILAGYLRRRLWVGERVNTLSLAWIPYACLVAACVIAWLVVIKPF